MMRKLLVIMAAALLLVGVFAMSAQASHILFDFGIIAPAEGSISYAGGATPLIGEDITVTQVFVEGFGTVPITNGLLNFQTGNFTGSDPLHWNFGPGGFLTITGTIPDGEPIPIDKEAVWTNAVVAIPSSPNDFLTVVGEFVDSSFNSAFLAEFGYAAGSLFPGNINLSFFVGDAIAPPVDFASTEIGSGDVTQVPVPPSLVLLGSGLLGLVGLRFRKNHS